MLNITEYNSEWKLSPFQHMRGTIQRTLKNKTRRDTQILCMLMYGSENLPLNCFESATIQAAEMRFLRRVSGYALTDHEHGT
jgi:hypothetical protein